MSIFIKPSQQPQEQMFLKKLIPVRFKDVGLREVFVYRNEFCTKEDDTHIRVGLKPGLDNVESFNPDRKVARIGFFRYPRPIKRRRTPCIV